MKKSLIVFSMILLLVNVVPVLADLKSCVLSASLVNQDPYPAIPGESVKLVFQIDGVDNPSCGKVDFTLTEAFPITIEGDTDPTASINAGGFIKDFSNFFLAPYTVIIDENALEGDYNIEALVKSPISTKIETFVITVEDSRADFEISVKDYSASENELTFEILNIAKIDVESLTIEVAKQENIKIKGSNRNIVGSLDSNEDTTFSFEAIPKNGDIILTVYYTDTIGVRRSLEKTVNYDSSYFTNRIRDQKGSNKNTYWVIGIVIFLAIWWWFRRRRKMQAHHAAHNKGRR